jgi:hypothetical protein
MDSGLVKSLDPVADLQRDRKLEHVNLNHKCAIGSSGQTDRPGAFNRKSTRKRKKLI